MKNLATFMLLGALLAGRASSLRLSDLTPLQREKYERMQGLEGTPARKHETLGSVEGVSCRRNLYFGSATSQEATERLFLSAASREADAVKRLACRDEGISLSRNCWASVICTGWAIRFDPADSSMGW